MTTQHVISIDAMSGDRAPGSVVHGLAKIADQCGDMKFILFGDQATLEALLKKRRIAEKLGDKVEIRHAPDTVAMDAKPTDALRKGRSSSMRRALDAVKNGEAEIAVSSGNTGALMTMSVVALRLAEAVDRPAIAALWPAKTEKGYVVALDLGADIRAEPLNLLQYALMGAEYARLSLGRPHPKVALLNVGVEPMKGPAEVREAAELISAEAKNGGFDYIGFIEGDEIPSGRADVVVTNGFAGNIALKAAEGTAKLIGDFLKDAFTHSILSKIAVLFAYGSLRRFKQRIDPRRVNGGVFLGLRGVVVKSHGGADATGFASAALLAVKMARSGFAGTITQTVANAAASNKDGQSSRFDGDHTAK